MIEKVDEHKHWFTAVAANNYVGRSTRFNRAKTDVRSLAGQRLPPKFVLVTCHLPPLLEHTKRPRLSVRGKVAIPARFYVECNACSKYC